MNKNPFLNILLLSALILFIASCVKAPQNQTEEENEQDLTEYFDFSTIATYTLSVDYQLTYNSPVVFYVYDQYPYISSPDIPDLEILNPELKPILKGIATDFGKYSGIVSIKNSVNQLYIYSTSIGVPQLLTTNLTNQVFSVDATNPQSYVTQSEVKSGSGIAQNALLPGNFTTIGTWPSSGKPDYLLPTRATITAGLIDAIDFSLPEYQSVPIHNPDYITNNVSASLKVVEDATIELVFVHEGAGFKNVLGYFHYPTNNPPTTIDQINKLIAFPNCSFSSNPNTLQSSDRIQLQYWNGTSFEETFPAGTSIGWFIVANGFKNGGVISETANIYYSLEQFNLSESHPDRKSHNVLLFDSQRQIVIIGFEDLPRSGGHSDDDFNDIVFYTVGTPVTAFEYGNLPLLKYSDDQDSDGIPDNIDEFPTDATLAYSTHYPAQDVYHTLAYEDLWPTKGDYDMNDVIVTYNSTHFLNANNKVVKVIDRFKPTWSGGILDVGFGYQMGVPSSSVQSAIKTSSFIDNNFRYTIGANGTETGQSKATIMVFDDITEMNLAAGNKPTIDFEITFNTPVDLNNLTTPPYNPFIVINKSRGMEVHMPNYKPTDKADLSLFGTYDDRSNSSLNRFYVSEVQMPWGIIIPTDNFEFPTERESIINYYPKFKPWAESFGAEYPNWYLQRN